MDSVCLFTNNSADKAGNKEEYEKVKSYLLLLRNNNHEQKEMAKKFFEKNKSANSLFECLNQIADNQEEIDDIKLDGVKLLNTLYGLNHKYYKKHSTHQDEEEYSLNEEMEGYEPYSKENKFVLNSLIDALPYIDSKMKEDNRLKEEVSNLIKEEMERGTKFYADYLNAIPEYKSNYSEFVRNEIQRVEGNIHSANENTKQFQNVKYTPKSIQNVFEMPPPSKIQDMNAWQITLNKIKISLSHLGIKNFNLDLLIKFGPEAWKRYLATFESFIHSLETEVDSLKYECDIINQERKLKQVKMFF